MKIISVNYTVEWRLWISQIRIEKITYTLGLFDNEKKAANAYRKALTLWISKGVKPKIKRHNGFYKKDLNGNVLKYYKDLGEVLKDGYNVSSVSSSLNNNYRYKSGNYKGFVWEHQE